MRISDWSSDVCSSDLLPLSTTFIGHLRSFGRPVYKLAQHFGPVAGALSRFDMLTRVALTPEGIPARDAIEAIDRMLDDGIRVLNLSFHSPSLDRKSTRLNSSH